MQTDCQHLAIHLSHDYDCHFVVTAASIWEFLNFCFKSMRF